MSLSQKTKNRGNNALSIRFGRQPFEKELAYLCFQAIIKIRNEIRLPASRIKKLDSYSQSFHRKFRYRFYQKSYLCIRESNRLHDKIPFQLLIKQTNQGEPYGPNDYPKCTVMGPLCTNSISLSNPNAKETYCQIFFGF